MRRRRPLSRKKLLTLLISAIIAGLVALFTPQEPALPGSVVGVHDGDTITVLGPDHQEIKVRLMGIDAPELSQPYGQASKRALSDLVFGRPVALINEGKDRYQRTLATVMVGETNANLQLVREGYAWRYDQYAKDPALLEAESEAKTRNLGLWQAPDRGPSAPVPPWEWRREKK